MRRATDTTRQRTRVVPAAMVVAGLVLVSLLLALPDHDSRAAPSKPKPAAMAHAVITVSSLGPDHRVPHSFLGLSTEYWTLPLYEQHLMLFERALSQLRVPGNGPLLLRVGGDSADHARWDPLARIEPTWQYGVTPNWLSGTSRLVRAMRLRLIVDLNLLTSSPGAAVQWARVALHGLPRHSIADFEVGNEPDIYNRAWWRLILERSGSNPRLLPPDLTAARYALDFDRYSRRLAKIAPHIPLAGPELANPGVEMPWIARLLASRHPRLGLVTAHRYPFGACSPRWSRNHPTIARILSQRATIGMARSVARGVVLAHRAGLPFRLTELNSVTCGGLGGVSNTFATALWAPDALFHLMRVGVDGVNIHVREFAINAAFTLSTGALEARPLLYGLIMFVRTLGRDARLLRVRVAARPSLHLAAWAVRVRGGMHVLLIDKSRRGARVTVRVPAAGPATLERLLAPSVQARTGVTLAGQHLTGSGTWAGRPVIDSLQPGRGGYRLTLAPGSAALLSLR